MRLRRILLVLSLLAFLSASAGGYLYYSALRKSTFKEAEGLASTYATAVEDRVSFFLSENLKAVKALAGLNHVRQALEHPTEASLANANLILDHFCDSLGAGVCYLMDTEGDTIASSNRHEPTSFVGKNYSFRPYFKKAIQGIPAVYMALGVTSKKRGAYYSHPVYMGTQDIPIGVVVIKASVEDLEKGVGQAFGGIWVLTDPHGVIFASSRKDWLFHLLWEVTPEQIPAIAATRQFGAGPWNWIGLNIKGKDRAVDLSGHEYLIHKATLSSYPGWNVIYLTSLDSIFSSLYDPLIGSSIYQIIALCFFIGSSILFLYKKASDDIVQRKAMEEALRESQRTLSTLMSNLPGMAYRCRFDRDRTMDFVSEGCVQLTGHVPSDFMESRTIPYGKLICPEDQDLVWDAVQTAIREKRPFEIVYRITTKAGDERWVLEQGCGVFSSVGELLALEGFITDITERLHAEMALKESESLLRTVINATKEAMISIGEDGLINLFNRAAEQMFARKNAEMIGKPLDCLMPEDYRQRHREYIKSFFEKWDPHGAIDKVVELPALRSDGNVFPMEISLSAGRHGKKRFVIAVARDVTERKQAEEALRQSEEKFKRLYDESKRAQEVYRSLLHSSADAIVMYDMDGRTKYISPAFTEIFGWTLEELAGNRIPFVPDSEMEATTAGIKEIIEKGKGIQGFETKRYTRDGRLIDVSISGSRYNDHEGKPAGMLVTLRDTSEKKRLEAQFQAAQRMESLGTLAGGIAHNFNNLLMGIQGYSSLMLLETEPAHPHFERLKGIEKLVQSGSRVTSQLLGYAREGKYKLKCIDLNQILRETADTFGETKKEIRIHQDLTDNLHGIEADQGQIEQVLLNLYINAADAMPRGGDLFLTTRNVRHENMTSKPYTPKPGNYVQLTVRDTGSGMDKKTMERIFEPFFSSRGLGKGTGLGLASVYGIIKAHGGYIDVNSQLGHGSLFEIYIPACKKEPKMEKESPAELQKGNETVLLVDDEDLIADVGNKMLKKLGYEVLLARGGEEATEVYKQNQDRIDMVILDMIMPDMSGGETYLKLKQINPEIKVLLSSGYSLNTQASEILKQGCDGFIQKPFDLEELSQRIREILAQNY